MSDAAYIDDETAFANAISMDKFLELVLENIHEFFKNQNTSATIM